MKQFLVEHITKKEKKKNNNKYSKNKENDNIFLCHIFLTFQNTFSISTQN